MKKKCVVCGGGGFIGSHLVKRLLNEGHEVIAFDIKKPEYNDLEGCNFIIVDLRNQYQVDSNFPDNVDEVYQLAADMGGVGFINNPLYDAELMYNSTMINLNVLNASSSRGVKKIFFSSSACVYNEDNQLDCLNPICVESSVYPANPDTEYGWEKLFSERLYLAYGRTKKIDIRIARFHNIFGPEGTYEGGREKAPAALCRKIAQTSNNNGVIEIWGSGEQTRSFLYIDDCLDAIQLLMESNFTEPINIGSEEMISINNLAKVIMKIANKNVNIVNIDGPTGVNGRKSDNDLIRKILNWEPKVSLEEGLLRTYSWINNEVLSKTINKPLICEGEYDLESRTILPIGNSKKWYQQYGYTQTGGPGYPNDLMWLRRPQKELCNYEIIENMKENDKYITLVNVVDPSYFIREVDGYFEPFGEKIITDIKNGKTKIIFLLETEGMSGTIFTKSDFKIINEWCLRHNINPKDITYITGNLNGEMISKEEGCEINVISHCIFEGYGNMWKIVGLNDPIIEFDTNDDPKVFISLNRNSRFHRILLLTELNEKGLLSHGHCSNRFVDNNYDVWVNGNYEHSLILDEEEKPFYIENSRKIFDMSPLILDDDSSITGLTDSVPIDYCKKSFLFLVTETLVEERLLFITEKTFKPIFLGMPFIILGSPNTIKEIRKMGYMTFDKWWDESYDEETDFLKRTKMITNIIDNFSKKSIEELTEIRTEMKPVLEYNKFLYRQRLVENYYRIDKYEIDSEDVDPFFMSIFPTYRLIYKMWDELNTETNE